MNDKSTLEAKLQSIKATIDKLDAEYEKGMIDIGRYTRLTTEYNIRKGELERELGGLAHDQPASAVTQPERSPKGLTMSSNKSSTQDHYRKLLDQYQFNLQSVQRRMSQLGPGDAAWITLENQEREYQRKIKEIEKLYGVDDAQRAGWREQLTVQRKNLRRLELQLAKYGSLNAPLSLLNQIEDVQADIKRLERSLRK